MAAPTFTLVLPRFPAIIFLAYNKHIISITCYCRWVVNTLALRAVLTHTCLLIRNYIVQSELPAKLLMLNKGVWRGGGLGESGTVNSRDTCSAYPGMSSVAGNTQEFLEQNAWEKPDRASLKEVLGGQYNYREGGRQVLRQGAKGRRRNRKWQCSKDPCAQKVSGGRTDPSPKYRWKVHGWSLMITWGRVKGQIEGRWVGVA